MKKPLLTKTSIVIELGFLDSLFFLPEYPGNETFRKDGNICIIH